MSGGQFDQIGGLRQCPFCKLHFLNGWELTDHLTSDHRDVQLSPSKLPALARGCGMAAPGVEPTSFERSPGGVRP